MLIARCLDLEQRAPVARPARPFAAGADGGGASAAAAPVGR